ncbi:hypothetical protein QQX98_008523 [Neonectria punicea]|uniref:NB-ARC domain-containing protein n=1 Tax=Neonectria punicea TaxID=979145 RepID=A0ABR1GVZ6_9HYPO
MLRMHKESNGDTPATADRLISNNVQTLAEACIRCARHSYATIVESWIEGSFRTFDYFNTQYLFSAATILAISSLVGGPQGSKDREDFDFAGQLLEKLRDSGSFAALEFCRHIEAMKTDIQCFLSDGSSSPDKAAESGPVVPLEEPSYQSAALWGPGGSGKTAIALEYAHHRCADPGCSVFWVRADNETAFKVDYVAVAKLVGLEDSPNGEDPLAAVRWFIESTPQWLLVVDNAKDPGLFSVSSAAKNLYKYIPVGSGGTVLWTSRDPRIVGTVVGTRRGINVNNMALDEAVKLPKAAILKPTHIAEQQAAGESLERLDRLPLAIPEVNKRFRSKPRSTQRDYAMSIQTETQMRPLRNARYYGDGQDSEGSTQSAQTSIFNPETSPPIVKKPVVIQEPAEVECGEASTSGAGATCYIDGLSDDATLQYLQAFAGQLHKDLKHRLGDICIEDATAEYLDQVLREFAWMLHGESSNPFQQEASRIIDRKRK